MTAETECCEACRPVAVELAEPWRDELRDPAGKWTTTHMPAGQIRRGHYITIRDKPYKVTATRQNRHDQSMVDLDLVAHEDIGIRHRMIQGLHKERTALPVIQFGDEGKKSAAAARARDRAENRRAYTARQRGLGPPGTAPRRNRVQWASQQYPGRNTTWANAPPLESPKA